MNSTRPYLMLKDREVIGIEYESVRQERDSEKYYVDESLAEIIKQRLGIEKIIASPNGVEFMGEEPTYHLNN